MIDVHHLSVELYAHLVEVPSPVAETPHARDAPPADIAGKHRPKPVPPLPYCLVADVDAALEKQIFDAPQ